MNYFFSPTVLFFVTLFADRFSKWWAYYALANDSWPICYGLNFVLSWNRGISWGLLSTDRTFGFTLLTGLITITVFVFCFYTCRRFMLGYSIIGEVLVVSGAISNIIDRLWYGAVLDFIQMYIAEYYFPVFNIADSFIVLGVAYIIISSWWCTNEEAL